MSRILDVDFGNSRTKWRLGQLSGSCTPPDLPSVAILPERIRVSMVAGDKRAIAQGLKREFGVAPEFAAVRDGYRGLTVAYDHPGKMGVDRWLALLAAFCRAQRPTVVFDFGTAVTVDVVSGHGRHAGGYIVPGLATMCKKLADSTRDVAIDGGFSDVQSLSPGITTSAAVRQGALRMLVDFVNATADRVERQTDGLSSFYATGGDAVAVTKHLQDGRFVIDPELVLSGLALALP